MSGLMDAATSSTLPSQQQQQQQASKQPDLLQLLDDDGPSMPPSSITQPQAPSIAQAPAPPTDMLMDFGLLEGPSQPAAAPAFSSPAFAPMQSQGQPQSMYGNQQPLMSGPAQPPQQMGQFGMGGMGMSAQMGQQQQGGMNRGQQSMVPGKQGAAGQKANNNDPFSDLSSLL